MSNCPKCGHVKPNTNNKFCSRKCANSRGPRTEDFKNKVRNKLSKPKEVKECPMCGKLHTNKTFCSKSCCSRSNAITNNKKGVSQETRNKISLVRKKMFKDGDLTITGGHTKWFDYKDIKVQGSYELRMCNILDNMLSKNLIQSWEYTNDRITYKGEDSKNHTYLLDFKVSTHRDTFYVETKGYIRANDELKWKSVRDKGYKLIVVFLEDIINLENGDYSVLIGGSGENRTRPARIASKCRSTSELRSRTAPT